MKTYSGIRGENEDKTMFFAEAVYFIMRTGAQWRELPIYYGQWRSVQKRFEEWSHKEIWNQVLIHFTEDYEGESVMINSTII